MQISLYSNSPRETREIGRKLGSALKGGDTVLLDGELGAGKTVFTSGIAEALGYTGYVTSPTYTIINEYNNLKTVFYHIDAYRVDDPDEILEAGFEDYINRQGVVVVEWASNIEKYAPFNSIRIVIEKSVHGENQREIKMEMPQERYMEYENIFD
ncbi:MAG: tRNA (adenosine(37)-N6)-threonylcarbamoyltransferase complex ATPase subunit type 1 TsaE [Oscillospiraceae bacterium]|nr:tRNA (adenosine(37)-N6)-threonylcarbamoyltransferase complex ATPase subunit type 1 TsaE [Oscillospiraceae bacterium]